MYSGALVIESNIFLAFRLHLWCNTTQVWYMDFILSLIIVYQQRRQMFPFSYYSGKKMLNKLCTYMCTQMNTYICISLVSSIKSWILRTIRSEWSPIEFVTQNIILMVNDREWRAAAFLLFWGRKRLWALPRCVQYTRWRCSCKLKWMCVCVMVVRCE